MDIRQYQGSNKYLKAADLKGNPVVVTIEAVVEETVGQGRDTEQKPVLSFAAKEKGLVLNTTNGNSIADALGFETKSWIGKEIELYPTTTEYAGRIVDCIRVRMPVAPAAAPVAAPVAAPTDAAPVAAPVADTEPAAAPVAAAPAAAAVGGSSEVPF